MKNVLSTGITSSSQQPYTKTTHEWYNAMTKEVAEAFVKSLIPSSWYTGKLVILSGCELTGTNPNARTISEGWVWYDGEIFRVEDGEFTTTGLEIGIWSINAASTNLFFSDGANKPVHQEKTFVMSNGLSGSGLFDEDETEGFSWMQDSLIESTPTCSVGTISNLKTRHRVNNNMIDFNISATVTITNAASANSFTPPRIIIDNIIPYEKYEINYVNIDYQNILVGNGYSESDIDTNQGPLYARTIGTTTISLILVARYPTTLTNGDKIYFHVTGSYELA